MYFMIYASSAIKEFSDSDLLQLLDKSRENNMRLGITGMLLYKGGNFMQVLEGEENTVRLLFEKISTDNRHKGILNMLEGGTTERQFPDWSMGFKNLNSKDSINVPGYNDFLNHSFTGEEFQSNPTKCQNLLLSFKENLR